MLRDKLKLTGIVGIVSALLFASAFAIYSGRKIGDGEATYNGSQYDKGGETTIIGCETNTEVRIFLSDLSKYAFRKDRYIADSNSGNIPQQRTYELRNNEISQGKYEVRTISSDTHFDHRSDSPTEDVQNQPDEQYYLTIDGQRTEKYSTDFTDYYDWQGAPGELIQDDDKNIDTVPSVIRNTWQGEYLGTVNVSNATNEVTVSHKDVFDDMTPRTNSVVPSAIILKCVEPTSPVLEVDMQVDGMNDGTFDPQLEQSKNGQTVSWKVIGRNVGDGIDNAAVVKSCAPVGTSYLVNTAVIVDGSQSGTLSEADGCFTWIGPLAPGKSVTIEFDVTADDIGSCDAADGAQDNKCSANAIIYSEATATTESNPADTDPAAINQLLPSLSIIKKVDGSDDNTTFSDISEQIIPDGRSVIWEITASNTGPGDLDDARVVDTYPSGVTIDSVTASVGSATTDGNTVVWNGALVSGSDVVLTVNSSIEDVAAFNACEIADAPGNVSGDGVCTNRAFVGEADSNVSDGLSGETKYDDAEVYAVLTPSLTIKKYVDGVDSDAVYSDQTPELVEPAQVFTWQVEGCNIGDSIEQNARIVDIIPNGVDLEDIASAVRVDGVAGSSSITITTDPESGRPAIVWNGSLPVGSCVTVEYNTTIADEASYNACLDVSVGGSGDCGIDAYIGKATDDSEVSVDLTTRLSDPAFVNMEFNSVLSIEKLVDGNSDSTFDPVVEQTGLNETFSWKIVATNNGNKAEPDARVVDILPANMELVSTTSSQVTVSFNGSGTTTSVNVVQDSAANAVVWDGNLGAGSSVEIVFLAQLTSEDMLNGCISETEGEHCRNTAEVGRRDVILPTGVVGQTDNDTADVFANPTGRLTVIKEVDVDGDDSWSGLETITLNEWFNWRISISNQGDGTVENAAFLDVFPEGVIIGEVTTVSGEGTVDLVAGTDKYQAFWTTPTLAPGATAEFVVSAKIVDLDSFNNCDKGTVDGNDDELCMNRVFVGSGVDVDSFVDVDSDDAQVDILRTPDLYISKLADGSDAGSDFSDFEEVSIAGEEFEFNITFGNLGTGVAEDVQVVDPMPTGVTYVSHSVDGSGLAGYDTSSERLTWNGSLNPSEEVSITIVARIDGAVQFIACDNADGVKDTFCYNTARLTHEDTELEDPAVVLSSNLKPELAISKTVDANNDNTFSEVEEVKADGSIVTWRVEVMNNGNAPANNVLMADDVEEGLEYMPNSIAEVEGAALGVAQYNDGLIEWRGDLGAGEKAVIQFQTRVSSAVQFTACNFADGNADDEQCTNNAVLAFESGDTPIDEDSANITTSLQTVLAYTGSSRNVSTAVVGGAIAFVATVLLFGAYASRGNGRNGKGDDDNGSPMVNHHPPQIVMPQ